MKSIFYTACLFLFLIPSAFSETSSDAFIEIGKTYCFTYTDTAKDQGYNWATVLKKGPNEWFYVKDIQQENEFWINLSNVIKVSQRKK